MFSVVAAGSFVELWLILVDFDGLVIILFCYGYFTFLF